MTPGGFTRATSITLWFIVVITIVSELSKPFKNVLAGVTGHHWVTKGVLSLALFTLIVLLSRSTSFHASKEVKHVVLSAILGGITILLFYVWHFIG